MAKFTYDECSFTQLLVIILPTREQKRYGFIICMIISETERLSINSEY